MNKLNWQRWVGIAILVFLEGMSCWSIKSIGGINQPWITISGCSLMFAVAFILSSF